MFGNADKRRYCAVSDSDLLAYISPTDEVVAFEKIIVSVGKYHRHKTHTGGQLTEI